MVVGKVSVLLLVVESADIVCCRRVEVQREVESVQWCELCLIKFFNVQVLMS